MVVFERAAREYYPLNVFQSFHLFMFDLCDSNYKNITRIVHSCRKKFTWKSLENQRLNAYLSVTKLISRFALEHRYMMSDHMPVVAVFEVGVKNRLDDERVARRKRMNGALDDSKATEVPLDRKPSSPLITTPLPRRGRGQFRSNSKVMDEVASVTSSTIYFNIQVARKSQDMKRFLKSQSAIHCMLNRLDLLFSDTVSRTCVESSPYHLSDLTVMCPTPVRRLQKRPEWVISRMRRLFSDVQIVEWNIKPQSSHLYAVLRVLLSQFKFLVFSFNVRSLCHLLYSHLHIHERTHTHTLENRYVRRKMDRIGWWNSCRS